MKKVSVGKRQFALVDADDYGWITHWRWHLNPQGYAVRKVYIDGRRAGSYTVFMHRAIMGTPQNMVIDHRNGIPLDNQKSNLRICTNNLNMRNRKLNINSTSGYKGVHFHHKLKKWIARIGIDGKRIHIGVFDSPQEAALAYNEAAKKYHGEYARLNT